MRQLPAVVFDQNYHLYAGVKKSQKNLRLRSLCEANRPKSDCLATAAQGAKTTRIDQTIQRSMDRPIHRYSPKPKKKKKLVHPKLQSQSNRMSLSI